MWGWKISAVVEPEAEETKRIWGAWWRWNWWVWGVWWRKPGTEGTEESYEEWWAWGSSGSFPYFTFLQSFYYYVIKSFMKIFILYQLFLLCLRLSKRSFLSETPAGLCPIFRNSWNDHAKMSVPYKRRKHP